LNTTASETNSNNNSTDRVNVENKQQNAQRSSHPLLPRALPSRDRFPLPSSPALEPSMMAHGNGYPILFGQFGSASLVVSATCCNRWPSGLVECKTKDKRTEASRAEELTKEVNN